MKRSCKSLIVPGNVFYQIMLITFIINCLQLTSHLSFSQPISIEINTNNQSETESIVPAANETVNSTKPVQSNELSSTSTSTLPPPLPTPLPSRGNPKLYSDLAPLKTDKILHAKVDKLGRIKRMKRTPYTSYDASSPYSLIKLLLGGSLTDSYPSRYSRNRRPYTTNELFGPTYSNNYGSYYGRNEYPYYYSNSGHSGYYQEPSSFYPGTSNLDLFGLDDSSLISPLDTDFVDNSGYNLDLFTPARKRHSNSKSEMIEPIEKRKRRLTGLYPFSAVERLPVLDSSLFDMNLIRTQNSLNSEEFD